MGFTVKSNYEEAEDEVLLAAPRNHCSARKEERVEVWESF